MPEANLHTLARPRADVLVVGAGMGGLAAAIELAAAGLDVALLEAGERVGGKMGVAQVDGVEFDTGPSVLTLPDVLDDLLRRAGSPLADELALHAPAPSFRYLFPDGAALDVYPDAPRTLESVAATLGAGAADELRGFLAYARRIWQASAPHFVYGAAPSLGALAGAGLGTLAALRHLDAWRSMRAAIRRQVRSPQLRMLLERYATYNGSDPRRAPATLNCIAHVELELGGYGVRGGVYEVARALGRAAERLGTRLHFGARVERLLLQDGRVRGVQTADGQVWTAPAVVANADAAQVFERLLPPEARQRSRAEPSMSGWVGVLRARRGAPRIAHTVLFPADYTREFADVFDRGRPPAEPTVYLCAQEAAHARRGWAEHEPLFVMANAPAEPERGATPAAAWAALRETVLRRLRDAALVDADDALVFERTPAELAAQFPGSRGGIYGAASNSPWSAFRRPPNRAPGVAGLYLASGSAHPGGGVPLCLLSGRAAARALLADLARAAAPARSA